MPEKIIIASDHGGLDLKNKIKNYLTENAYLVTDLGCHTEDSCDYPDYAQALSDKISSGDFKKGILFCGTGIGMAIAANKVRGIRAASIVDTASAKLAREHNDLNVLCLGGRVLQLDQAKEILQIFLSTKFAGGRHGRRVKKIHQLER